MYDTNIVRQDKTEVKNNDGVIVKKVIKVFKPVPYKGEENPDIPEVGVRIAKDAVLDYIKIAELKNGRWEFREIKDENEIALWLFEN